VATRCQKEIARFLRSLTPEKLFLSSTWKKVPAFVKVVPNGDLLPSRAKYSSASNDWQVAVNHLFATDHAGSEGLWFSLPDVAVSVLLTGKVPRIVDAFKLVPVGKVSGLRPVRLGGEVSVNPLTQDLFRTVIEQRKSKSNKGHTSLEDADRLDKALKVLANATSCGIYAEMNRQETESRVKVQCQGIDPEPYACSAIHPEKPGEFCFPPLASLITGAARLMLALLEHSVSALGGTYAMEDTDSMAIVATEQGGTIPCKGGNLVSNKGTEGIKALTWKQVRQIVAKFKAYALRIILAVAQKLPQAEGVAFLRKCILDTDDDTMAFRILTILPQQKDDSKIDVPVSDLYGSFITRMRNRYGRSVDATNVDLSSSDPWAFNYWGGDFNTKDVKADPEDREIQNDFWLRYIGNSRARLAHAFHTFFMPIAAYSEDPALMVRNKISLEDLRKLYDQLPDDGSLTSNDQKSLNRLRRLLDGEFKKGIDPLSDAWQ
jgi:hypothetical protein